VGDLQKGPNYHLRTEGGKLLVDAFNSSKRDEKIQTIRGRLEKLSNSTQIGPQEIIINPRHLKIG